ncbi:aminopeptidase N-like [Lucilia sericata]|uniref:aminopeptidase N-like n=1 Tax=Lucilia sericata TaxID=13632 RepID=UPI0018A83677|nr:aminopeptidase N-like [Lucilia sericata]
MLTFEVFCLIFITLVKSDETAKENNKTSLDYRLPNESYPLHYDLKLTTNVHTGEKSFKGEIIIDIIIVEATAKIYLHACQLEVEKVTIESLPTGESEELEYVYEKERHFLILNRSKLDMEFSADTQWKLSINYSGELGVNNEGFFLSSYMDEEDKEHFLAATQFESTYARLAFPCYDEPAKLANFTITINHSPNYTALSNLPVNEELSSPGKTVFLTTPPMATYLVAFIISDFEYTEIISNDLPLRLYSQPERKLEHEWALTTSILIVEHLSKYYGIDYMLPKLDQVALPNFTSGGMENWGLATYREEALLYNKNSTTVFSQTDITTMIAHELCHQWFGNYVTIQWWTYLWLKEGLASLCSYTTVDNIYPEWDIMQEFHTNSYQTALVTQAINTSRAMTSYVQTPNEIAGIYDAVSYNKASCVFNMWRHALTEDIFKQALYDYLRANNYSTVEENQLFTAIDTAMLEKNSNLSGNFTEIMLTWSHQGNYPLLNVKRDYKSGTFSVTQETFYEDKNIKGNKTWFIPFNYVTASTRDFSNTIATDFLLNIKEIVVEDAKIAPDDWLLLNKQSTGFYRINYDKENWNLIIDSLKLQYYNIHPLNRAQLLHDAYYLSVSNHLTHDVFLNLMTYLEKEEEYAPWSTVNDIVVILNRYLNSDENIEDLKFFIAQLTAPIYDKLGIKDVPGDQHYQKYTRSFVINIACWAGLQACLRETKEKFKAYIEHNTLIEPNLQAAIFCNGLIQSTDEEFNFVYNKLMDSKDKILRSELISSLACSLKENHIKQLIESSIDEKNKLLKEERYTLLSPVIRRSGVGILACIEFLSNHWQAYGNLKTDDSNLVDYTIREMSVYVMNKKQKETFLALVDKVKDKNMTTTLETDVKSVIKSNFDWLDNNRKALMSWLEQYHRDNGNDVDSTV